MTGFDELKARMDADVDTGVGNSITYRLSADAAPLESKPGVPTIPGFVMLNNQEGSLAGLSAHRERWACKVHKRWLPGRPTIRHRIDHANLDGVTYRPAGDTIDDDGDYYLFDLQVA